MRKIRAQDPKVDFISWERKRLTLAQAEEFTAAIRDSPVITAAWLTIGKVEHKDTNE